MENVWRDFMQPWKAKLLQYLFPVTFFFFFIFYTECLKCHLGVISHVLHLRYFICIFSVMFYYQIDITY